MSTKNNGGPAFPVADMQSACPQTITEQLAMARGMTLRDYFAAKAMLIGWHAYHEGYTGLNDRDEPNVKTIAECAYQLADAMLAARQEGGAA